MPRKRNFPLFLLAQQHRRDHVAHVVVADGGTAWSWNTSMQSMPSSRSELSRLATTRSGVQRSPPRMTEDFVAITTLSRGTLLAPCRPRPRS